MKPSRSILDSRFKYTNSSSTDLAETFRRIRREQKKQQEAQEHKVQSIFRSKANGSR